MSRSSEWYADPANREKRKARMRVYGKALVDLGRAHPEERLRLYQDGIAEGFSPSLAEGRAGSRLREAYKAEFRRIFEERLRESGVDG